MPPIGFETSGKCLPPKPHLNPPENWGTSHLPLREVEESPTAKWGHKKGKDEVSASKSRIEISKRMAQSGKQRISHRRFRGG